MYIPSTTQRQRLVYTCQYSLYHTETTVGIYLSVFPIPHIDNGLYILVSIPSTTQRQRLVSTCQYFVYHTETTVGIYLSGTALLWIMAAFNWRSLSPQHHHYHEEWSKCTVTIRPRHFPHCIYFFTFSYQYLHTGQLSSHKWAPRNVSVENDTCPWKATFGIIGQSL